MKKKILIFGVNGFVGQYLVQEFLNDDYIVYGSDINSKNMNKNIIFKKADLVNEDEINELIYDIQPDMIINLAAISSVGMSWKNPQLTFSINVLGALNILEAARQLSNKPKIMFIGSSEEYDSSDKPINEETKLDSNSPYGVSKVTQEKIAEMYSKQYDMKIYFVRPFNHTGVGQNDTFVLPSFCKQVAEIEKSKKGGIVKVGNLSAVRDFSDVRDVVRAYKMIIESDYYNTVYNIGSGRAYSIDELLNYIISLSHENISIEIDEKRFRPIDTPYICCDNSKIKEKLGWEPKYTIYDTLKELYYYFLQ